MLLHAPSSPYLSLLSTKSRPKAGLLSPENCLLSSDIYYSIPPKRLENSIRVSSKRSVFSSAITKAASVEAGASAISTGVAESDVLKALSQIIDPDFGTDIVSCGFVKDLDINESSGEVSFRLELTTPACPIKDMFEQKANEVVAMLPWVKNVNVTMWVVFKVKRHKHALEVPLSILPKFLYCGLFSFAYLCSALSYGSV